ncbi:hypothetical protein SLE2022_202320 [Rubroshorea leprosula]
MNLKLQTITRTPHVCKYEVFLGPKDNLLGGWLPASMREVKALKSLDLSHSKFTGEIPDECLKLSEEPEELIRYLLEGKNLFELINMKQWQ